MFATMKQEGMHHKECENIIMNWRIEVYSHLNSVIMSTAV